MKKKIPVIFYAIALLNLIYILYNFIARKGLIRLSIIILLILTCLFIFFAGRLLSKENDKVLSFNFKLYFIIYILFFLDVIFFESTFRKSNLYVNDSFLVCLKNNINIIPFKSIMYYIRSFDSLYSNNEVLLNLLGNFVMCVPFSFFLPVLFDSYKKTPKFLITVIAIILFTEILQLVTCTGSLDVDDILLNLSGALIFYRIFKIDAIRKLIENIFFMRRNKINKKEIKEIFIILAIVIISFITIVSVKCILYNKNFDEYKKRMYPKVDLSFDSICTDNNLMYEDETQNYFLECYDNDKFYFILNDVDKFKIRELIDSDKYMFNIDKVLGFLRNRNIKFNIEPKYKFYEFKVKNENNYTFYLDNTNENDIVKILIKKSSNGARYYDVYFIPKKSGNTDISFNVDYFDEYGNLKITKNVSFNVQIDENFNVEYEILEG